MSKRFRYWVLTSFDERLVNDGALDVSHGDRAREDDQSEERPEHVGLGQHFQQIYDADPGVQFIIGQVEVCPETSRKHVQACIGFKHPCTLKHVKDTFKDPRLHAEPARDLMGSVAYCSKESTRIGGTYSCGDVPSSSKKSSDLQKLVDEIKKDPFRFEEAVLLYPTAYIRNCRGIKEFCEIQKSAVRRRNTTLRKTPVIHVIIGPTGIGKSLYAWHNFPGAYRFPYIGDYWENYNGENIVVFDEFRGQVSYERMLMILDVYPMQVNVKGKSTFLDANVFVFTSNVECRFWWDVDDVTYEPFQRRLRDWMVDVDEETVREWFRKNILKEDEIKESDFAD